MRTQTQVKFSSVAQSCLTLCDPMDRSTPGLPVHYQFPEFTQIHVHWISDAIQPSHPLSSPCPPALNLSQHQGLFKWVSSSHHVAKVLEFQLQHQSFQWIFRTDFLSFHKPFIILHQRTDRLKITTTKSQSQVKARAQSRTHACNPYPMWSLIRVKLSKKPTSSGAH